MFRLIYIDTRANLYLYAQNSVDVLHSLYFQAIKTYFPISYVNKMDDSIQYITIDNR